MEKAEQANQRWSMGFVTDRLENGRYFPALTLVDQYTRECPALEPAHSLTAAKVAHVLDAIALDRGYPESITVDNGTEFSSRIMDGWAYEHGVKLDFIRPVKPVDIGYIESVDGRLHDECLNTHFQARGPAWRSAEDSQLLPPDSLKRSDSYARLPLRCPSRRTAGQTPSLDRRSLPEPDLGKVVRSRGVAAERQRPPGQNELWAE